MFCTPSETSCKLQQIAWKMLTLNNKLTYLFVLVENGDKSPEQVKPDEIEIIDEARP